MWEMEELIGGVDGSGISSYYEDTDSKNIHVSCLKKLEGKISKLTGLPFIGPDIGQFSDDLGSNCRIIRMINIKPKLYCSFYLKKTEKGVRLNLHKRGAGIPKSLLNWRVYDRLDRGKGFKFSEDRNYNKVGFKPTGGTKSNISAFQIYKDDITKRIAPIYDGKEWNEDLKMYLPLKDKVF